MSEQSEQKTLNSVQIETAAMIIFSMYPIVITWAEDILGEDSPGRRAQPEDEYYYCHNILGKML